MIPLAELIGVLILCGPLLGLLMVVGLNRVWHSSRTRR